jgi:hypothetical protein
VGAAVVVAVLAAVEVVAGVAAAATTPDDGPISTSNANEATKHAAPVATANSPSLCTADQSMRRD